MNNNIIIFALRYLSRVLDNVNLMSLKNLRKTDSLLREDDSYEVKMQTYGIAYELIISVLYVWSTFEAYTYDAKTRTGEVWLYIVSAVLFAVFIHSYRHIVMMNFFAAFFLPAFLFSPTIHNTGSYFDFQPYVGWLGLIVLGLGQALLFTILKSFIPKYMTSATHLKIGGIMTILFTAAMSVLTIATPMRPFL